jgi:cysteine protease ATG4
MKAACGNGEMELGFRVPRHLRGLEDCVLLRAPPPGEASGWQWLQKAKSKLYTLLQARRECHLTASPVYLMGTVYGDPVKSLLASPPLLVASMLVAGCGVKVIERSYGDGAVQRTFSGNDALAWFEQECPEASVEEATEAMLGVLRSGLVVPLGATGDGSEAPVDGFVPSALYRFADEATVIGPAKAGFLKSSTDDMAAAAMQDFLGHFQTLVWLTYRQGFPPIEPTGFSSDVGWGCVLRTGQMVLANALHRHILGPDWRLGSSTEKQMVTHRAILGLFVDLPGPRYPYSIHNIAHVGTLFRKAVGEWFGPSVIGCVLRVLVRKYSTAGFTFYLAPERMLYRENVMLLCRSTPAHEVSSPRLPANSPPFQALDGGWRPVLIMACVRLGMDVVLHPQYVERVAELFRIPQCAGIVGGKPNASLFMVGMQDEHVLYLDPHVVQAAQPELGEAWSDVASVHTTQPLKMPCREVDPCMGVCFLCSTQAEFEDLCERLSVLEAKHSNHVIGVAEREPDYGGSAKRGEDPLAHLVFN